MKVVVIGGSSPSTPALFASLAAHPNVPPMKIVLVGRSHAATMAVARASRALTTRTGLDVSSATTDDADWQSALKGADIVVLQIRVGGYEGRSFCETFPLRYGIPGDHALGPGGLAAACFAWPAIQRLCTLIHAAAPASLLVMLTSPVGIMVRLAERAMPAHRIAGLCELPWTTLLDIAAALDVPVHAIDFDYFGLNHLGWFHRLAVANVNLISQYAQHRAGDRRFPDSNLITTHQGVPTKYWRLHYRHEQVVAQQCRTPGRRAAFLASHRTAALKAFADGTVEEIHRVLSRRPAPWYDKALTPLLIALAGHEAAMPFFLSTAGGSGAEPSDVVDEAAYSVERGALVRRASLAGPSREINRVLAPYVAYERLALSAVADCEVNHVAQALRAHPWIGPQVDVAAMATDIQRAVVWVNQFDRGGLER